MPTSYHGLTYTQVHSRPFVVIFIKIILDILTSLESLRRAARLLETSLINFSGSSDKNYGNLAIVSLRCVSAGVYTVDEQEV